MPRRRQVCTTSAAGSTGPQPRQADKSWAPPPDLHTQLDRSAHKRPTPRASESNRCRRRRCGGSRSARRTVGDDHVAVDARGSQRPPGHWSFGVSMRSLPLPPADALRGRPPIVTDNHVRASAIADASEHGAIVSRRARTLSGARPGQHAVRARARRSRLARDAGRAPRCHVGAPRAAPGRGSITTCARDERTNEPSHLTVRVRWWGRCLARAPPAAGRSAGLLASVGLRKVGAWVERPIARRSFDER